MKKNSYKLILTIFAAAITTQALAGNKDRSGQAGATELLINPWAQSTGVFGLNTSYVQGVEAMKGNIAGLAFVDNADVGISYSEYLRSAGVGIENAAFAKRFGTSGVLGVDVMSMSFGSIDRTEVENPDAGIGTFTPQFFNIQVGFAKEFSRSIHAGVGVTFISESISDVRASGAAFEAGIQYTTGDRDQFHFGVTLRNVGTNMKFSGEGFNQRIEAPAGNPYLLSQQIPSDKFEMPSYLNIGVAYDFYLGNLEHADDLPKHRLTVMGGFTSNSFNNDYLGLGLEYAFREIVMLRGGFRYEKDIFNTENSTTFYSGYSAGATVKTTLGKNGPRLAIDYSFRPTQRPDNGVHTFSLRFMFRNAKKVPATQDAGLDVH